MHTKEPWDVYDGNANGKGLLRIEAGHDSVEAGTHIASFVRGNRGSVNADRIVACVNALAGIDDPAALRASLEELRAFAKMTTILPKDAWNWAGSVQPIVKRIAALLPPETP